MDTKIIKPLLLSVAVLMGACSGEGDKPAKDSVFQEQVETIDKARDVEKILQKSSEKQRQAIGEI